MSMHRGWTTQQGLTHQAAAVRASFPWVQSVSHSWTTEDHSRVSVYSIQDIQACRKCRNYCLPGVPIPLHNNVKNIMSLSVMALSLWLAHPKSPMSCSYLKKDAQRTGNK